MTITIPFKYVSHQKNSTYNLSITISEKPIKGSALKDKIMDTMKKSTSSVPQDIRIFSGKTEIHTLDLITYEIQDGFDEFIVLESEEGSAKVIENHPKEVKEVINTLYLLSENETLFNYFGEINNWFGIFGN